MDRHLMFCQTIGQFGWSQRQIQVVILPSDDGQTGDDLCQRLIMIVHVNVTVLDKALSDVTSIFLDSTK